MGAVTASTPPDDDIEALRGELVQSLAALRISADNLHHALNEGAAAYLAVRAHLLNGGRVSDLEQFIEPAPLRAGLSGALDEFERRRHENQRTMFRLLRAEGWTPAHIARLWGISRQLVSRLINEHPGTKDAPEPPDEAPEA
jgi:hypothetical protein